MWTVIRTKHRSSASPLGEYLHALKSKFKGPVVADLLCYLRLYTELALRAKGILMMNESGFEVSVDEETQAKFDEMRYLESDRKSTRLNSSHITISYAVFCLKKKK